MTAAAFVASSLFILVPENWVGVGLGISLMVAAAAMVTRWSRSEGWAHAHGFALAAGATLTYAWLGFVVMPFNGTASTVNLIGQGVLVVAAIALLVAARRVY